MTDGLGAEEFFRQIDKEATAETAAPPNLAELLDVHSWAALDIPPEPRLLGALVTPSSRTFLVGRTGSCRAYRAR